MIKIFKEDASTTVVFPAGAEEAIEKMVKELFPEEAKQQTNVQGLKPDTTLATNPGIRIVDNKKSDRKYNVKLDKRNPFPNKLPKEVFRTEGIKALKKYVDMRLDKSPYDRQISRELFADFAEYLKELLETDLDEIPKEVVKDDILTLTNVAKVDSMNKIIKATAFGSVEAFLEEADDSSLYSSYYKTLSDAYERFKNV